MTRAVVAIILATGLAACTSGGNGDHSSQPTSDTPAGTSSGAAAKCTEESAQATHRTLVDKSGFTPSCIKIKAKSQLQIINDDSKKNVAHTAITSKSSPQQLNVHLPHRNSTYAHVFRRVGTYVFTDTTSGDKLTLFVG